MPLAYFTYHEYSTAPEIIAQKSRTSEFSGTIERREDGIDRMTAKFRTKLAITLSGEVTAFGADVQLQMRIGFAGTAGVSIDQVASQWDSNSTHILNACSYTVNAKLCTHLRSSSPSYQRASRLILSRSHRRKRPCTLLRLQWKRPWVPVLTSLGC